MLPMKLLFVILQCCDLKALAVRLANYDKNEW